MLRTFCHNLIDKLPASGLEEARDFLVSAIEFYEEYGEEEPLANQSETGEGVKVEIGGSSDKDNLALVVQVLQERVKFLEKYSHFHFETKD